MRTSSTVLLFLRAISDLDEASIRPTRDPPPGVEDDGAEAALLLAQDRDRIAEDMNTLVVRAVLRRAHSRKGAGLMGDHPGARERSRKPSTSSTWRSGTSGTSCSITSTPSAQRPAPRLGRFEGRQRRAGCPSLFPVRRRPAPAADQSFRHAAAGCAPSRRASPWSPPCPGPHPEDTETNPQRPRPESARIRAGSRAPEQPGTRPRNLPRSTGAADCTTAATSRNAPSTRLVHAPHSRPRPDRDQASNAITCAASLLTAAATRRSKVGEPGRRRRKLGSEQTFGSRTCPIRPARSSPCQDQGSIQPNPIMGTLLPRPHEYGSDLAQSVKKLLKIFTGTIQQNKTSSSTELQQG